MATASNSTFACGEGSRKDCVKCHANQPQDGRILHCLHVICVSCLDEIVTNEGVVECAVCDKITKPVYRSVSLRNQLVFSSPVFANVTTGSLDAESVTERLVCDFCETSAAKPASHVCSGCDGILLCNLHAEDHSKKRAFRTHGLQALADVNSSGSFKVQQKCPLHIKHELLQFCKTCDLAVCQQCILKGHNDHQVTSLSEAAQAQRSSMKKALDTEIVATADGANTGSENQPVSIETLKSQLSAEIRSIDDEATTASKQIAETFSHMKKLIEKKEAELLHNVDVLRWKQQQPLDKKIQTLTDLEDAHQTVVEVAKYLTGSQASSADIMQLGKFVEQKLMSCRSDAESQKSGTRATIQATTITAVLAKLEEDVKAVMTVYDDGGLDVSQATAVPVQLRFNPQKCSDAMILSNSEMVAVYKGNGEYGNVYGREAYTEGVHKWSVKIGGSALSQGGIAVGVAHLSSHVSTKQVCARDSGVGWDCNGIAYNSLDAGRKIKKKDLIVQNSCKQLEDGDVFTLTLDCAAKTLELHVHRTDERVVIKYFYSGGEPLYFCVFAAQEDRRLEIL